MKYKFVAGALILVVGSCFLINFMMNDANVALIPKEPQVEENNFSNGKKSGENIITRIVDQDEKNLNEISIPSKEQVKDTGFPKNKNGETYGPDIKEFMYEPDLLLAINDDGVVGYIRQSDMDDGVKTPDQAIEKEVKSYEINMYLEDGETCIGTFKIH